MSDLKRAAANLKQAASALSASAQAMAQAASALQSTTQSLKQRTSTSEEHRNRTSTPLQPLPPNHVRPRSNADVTTKNTLPESQNAGTVPTNLNIPPNQAAKSVNIPLNGVPQASSTSGTTDRDQTVSSLEGYDSSPSESQSQPDSTQNRYHMLLKNESDILLATCSLAQGFNLVTCYLPVTSLVSVPLYLRLFEQVLDCPTATVTTTTDQTKAQADVDEFFNSHARGILLLPESIAPQIDINPRLSSCMIHIGWPSRQDNYEIQVTKHNMKYSILVVFAEDADIYSDGPMILSQTHEWPNSDNIISNEMPNLSPRFQEKLSQISLNSKERIYPEWISDHGPRGRRHVVSWPPTTLVYRANLYLLDVLGYEPKKSLNESEATLPHVSAGFVAHNQLEAAVEDGVLNAGAAPVASQDETAHSNAIPLNDSGPSAKKTPPPAPPRPEPARTYIVLDSEFDLYPFIFESVSSKSARRKVVCFVKELMVANYLIDQFKESAETPVYVALAQAASKLQQVAEEFHSTEKALLFWGAYTEPHPSLTAGRIDCVVHMGWIKDLDLRNRQSELSKFSTVILSRSEYSDMEQGRKTLQFSGLVGSQKATALNKRGDNSQLDDARKRWRACLAATPVRTLRNCYAHWMMHHFAGKHKVEGWTAVDLVKAANHFAHHVLLRGPNTAASVEQTVGGQLSVTPGLMNHLGLQAAQRAGLLIVDS